MLVRAGAPSGRVAESDGAPAQAVTRPRDFGPLGRCTHIGVGERRDRFSTIDKRGRRWVREPAHGLGEWPRAMARRGSPVSGPRDFCPLGFSTPIGVGARRDRFSTIDDRGRRCLREPAHGLGEWPREMARRGRRLPELEISAYTPQHVPYACSHRLQLSSLHLDEALWQTVRRSSKAGFGRLHVRTCHTPCNASTGPCTSTLSSDSRPLASRGEETLGEVVPNTAHQMNARAV